ncbi:phage protein NinX family protein [Rahnella bonaserana]|uniref:phage protein NinX family protein n=1 Tax=Rahnella bonaserana TaxID=2816248 RepID=UPI003209406A
MKDYSAMHDAEINMLVCKRLGLGISSYCRILSIGDYSILLDDNNTLVDYCNNPADAWPIILENKISINHWCTGEWTADCLFGDFVFSDTPLRAAMIVYLMMKDAEKCDG